MEKLYAVRLLFTLHSNNDFFYFWYILRCRQADVFATVSAQASIIAGFVVTGNTLSLVLLLPMIIQIRQ
jgi:hypothetical protein